MKYELSLANPKEFYHEVRRQTQFAQGVKKYKPMETRQKGCETALYVEEFFWIWSLGQSLPEGSNVHLALKMNCSPLAPEDQKA